VSEGVDILRKIGDVERLVRFWRSTVVVVGSVEADWVEEVVSSQIEETRLEIRMKIGTCVQYALVD
jgi:UDP-N-acetylmuramyl pentapeptide synthase